MRWKGEWLQRLCIARYRVNEESVEGGWRAGADRFGEPVDLRAVQKVLVSFYSSGN